MKKVAEILFKLRSYTPIPFVLIMLIFFNGNLISWIVGGSVLILGELIRLWGVTYAGSLTRTTTSVKANELVTSGPFSFVRNPLYIGNILMYLGFGIISMALFPYLQITALIWFVFQYILIVSIEEEFLLKKFGNIYQKYTELVPPFIPRLSPVKMNETKIVMPNFRKGLKSELRTIQALGSVTFIALIISLIK